MKCSCEYKSSIRHRVCVLIHSDHPNWPPYGKFNQMTQPNGLERYCTGQHSIFINSRYLNGGEVILNVSLSLEVHPLNYWHKSHCNIHTLIVSQQSNSKQITRKGNTYSAHSTCATTRHEAREGCSFFPALPSTHT